MSLKAYDGMMSRKSIKYIQDEIIKRLDRLKELSENKLAEKYAELFYEHIDKQRNVIDSINFDAINEDVMKDKISKIKIDDETTIFSYIFQASKILSESYFRNEFTVNLNISLSAIHNKKILIYPIINVNEHKPILLEFLEDWYCQNGSDPDENVSRRQWKQREKDWYEFNDRSGFNMTIQLFDPTNYRHSLNKNFRGAEMTKKVLEYIPSDETRIRRIARNEIIKNYEKEKRSKNEVVSIWEIMDRLSKEGSTEIDDYIKTNNIIITKIDEEFLLSALLKPNPLAEIRKEKLDEINKNINE